MRLAIFGVLLYAGWALAVASEQGADTALPLIEPGKLDDLRWPDFSNCQTYVRNFYASRSYALAWTRGGAATPQAQALVRLFQNAAERGLDPENYDGSRWRVRLDSLPSPALHNSAEARARFDLALTVSALRYISDLHIGRVNPKVLCFGLDVDQNRCDFADVLSQRLVNAPDVAQAIEQIEPPYPGYRYAKQALQRYIQLAREDDGELLPATKKPVEPGSSYAGIARLQRLLHRLGDLPADASVPMDAQVYQAPLVDAVKRFQVRHGLEADGRLGPSTLRELNTPLSRRVRQLQLVLERWRWIPAQFTKPPIIVNIPEFRLYALNEQNEPALEMKVVVGGAYHRQTPVFAEQMTHVIFRPYWNVPLSIQRNELLPKIREDATYLAANDYEVVNARGERVASATPTPDLLAGLRSGKLQIRQVPGPKNALGFVKFLFPNPYNVYMHGTPAQKLFAKSRRDFSHGCIRVEKPEELALWVLRDKPGWDLARIQEAEDGPRPLQVNLDHPIPVLILYGTAVARANGEVYFYDDIYRHDARLDELLANGYPYSGWTPTSDGRGPRPRE